MKASSPEWENGGSSEFAPERGGTAVCQETKQNNL
jgi:hypothetical protein